MDGKRCAEEGCVGKRVDGKNKYENSPDAIRGEFGRE